MFGNTDTNEHQVYSKQVDISSVYFASSRSLKVLLAKGPWVCCASTHLQTISASAANHCKHGASTPGKGRRWYYIMIGNVLVPLSLRMILHFYEPLTCTLHM
jgi:hypothetical protein